MRSFGAAVNQRTGIRAAGWVCLLLGLMVLVGGLALGWVEFKVAGALAVLSVAVGLLFTIGKPRFEVRLEMAERSVVVGTPTGGELAVRNTAQRRHLGSRLDLPIADDVASFSVPPLGAGMFIRQRFRVPTEQRGLVRIGPAESVAGDPFALTGRQTRWTGMAELFVHPRTVRLPGRQSGFVHDLEGHASPHLSSADMNFHALRPYAPGDDRRHVHWRSTARTGALMVRQFEESRMSHVVVALDTGRLAWLDADEFEIGVSCAASVAVQTLMGESPLALRTSHETLTALTPSKALDALCTVGRGIGGGVVDLVHATRAAEPSASVAVFITGSVASMTQVRRAGSLFDIDTRVIGVRVEEGAELRVRTAGNVSVVQVGALEELPRAMRRAME
ncbi:DUF58 domain-containing protein [Tessaracoccus antarcticus]|uniref:DUF58 domain-containing protein n=1 Tax=Tessaracoccus antarcticus TaxID=2479848 RepID=A0A3M0GAH0_9ACTN|nr:DUF58 domain-containing protein [Tessaracoccus antarcticus]